MFAQFRSNERFRCRNHVMRKQRVKHKRLHQLAATPCHHCSPASPHDIEALDPRRFEGRVTGLSGALIEATGPMEALALGARATIASARASRARRDRRLPRRPRVAGAVSIPIEAIRPGARVALEGGAPMARPSRAWLGRVIDCFGEPVDGEGPLPQGAQPAPGARGRRLRRMIARASAARLDVGVRALNMFAAHLPRPAHGRVLGLRRRQIGADVDAGARRRRGRDRHRPGRRARPRSEGIHRGHAGRGGPAPLRRRRRDLGRNAPRAAGSRRTWPARSPSISATKAWTCCC